MSREHEHLSSGDRQAINDYFSRPVNQTPWTEDLINLETAGETQNINDTEVLSPVESDLLTPATLSPPSEPTERSPLLAPLPNHANISGPIVCCRAGGRPANIQSNNTNPPLFPAGPPQNMGGRPTHNGSSAEPDLERNKARTARCHRRQRRWPGSKYVHRWILALGLLVALFTMERFIFCEDSAEPSSGQEETCSLPYCSNNLTHSFAHTDSFSLLENFHIQGLPVRGTVWLEPAPEDQKAAISVVVSYATSNDRRVTKPRWELTESSVRLLPPTVLSKRAALARIFGSCLSVDATVYLKPSVKLATLSIETTHLSIVASPNLFVAAKTPSHQNPKIESTTFVTKSSPITLPNWSSRKTTLRTVSGAITGHFNLLDLLSLNSLSGSITASVQPGEADSSNPEPAVLSVSTASGSVRVTYPPGSGAFTLPAREYRTSVSTMSGSIKGTYLLGAATSLTSTSGTIEADLLPYDSQSESSSLRTSSSSGAAHINVLESYRNGGKAFKGLHSVHESAGSGSIKLWYPGDWEGKIAAATGSGSVTVKGQGVVVDEASGYVKHVAAHKGEKGGSSIEARTGSASIDVLIGSL